MRELTTSRSRAIVLVAWIVLAAGCGGGSKPTTHAPRGGSGLISLAGSIGAVKLGVSTEANVTALVGAPEATSSDNFRFPGAPEYNALGYGCTLKRATNRIPLTYGGSRGPYCVTVYYINVARDVLGSFWTASPAFHTAGGTRVGSATEVAVRKEHRPAMNGCHIGLTETSKSLTLLLDLVRYKETPLHPGRNDHLAKPTGGRVGDFAIDSLKHGVGLLFC